MLMVRPSGFPEVAQLGRPLARERMAALHPELTCGAGTKRQIYHQQSAEHRSFAAY
jgi:hypothetical protein